jgi:hypothetical protein
VEALKANSSKVHPNHDINHRIRRSCIEISSKKAWINPRIREAFNGMKKKCGYYANQKIDSSEIRVGGEGSMKVRAAPERAGPF